MTQPPRVGHRSHLLWMLLAVSSAIPLTLAGRMDLGGASPRFHAQGDSYTWHTGLVAGHVIADTLIALSLVAISSILWYCVRQARGRTPFNWAFDAFGIFLVACAATHVMDVITMWKPWFWMSLDIKTTAAAAGVVTAVALPIVGLRILSLTNGATISEERPGPLETARHELEQRVAERTRTLTDALAREQALRNEAQAASRSKDEFLRTVSHELRTPLTAIYGWARMLKSGQVRPGQEQQAIDAIERNARAQTRLIKDFQDVADAASGRLRLNLHPVALPAVLNAAIDSIRQTADARKIRVDAAIDLEVGPVSGDPDRLQQIVSNLLSNAITFTPTGGRVEVRLERADAGVAVVVSDNGQEIAPELLPYVLDRLRQGAGDVAARSGHGLGLVMVRHLVELHGGTVTVESDGEALGATFRIVLPSLRQQSGMTPAAGRRHQL